MAVKSKEATPLEGWTLNSKWKSTGKGFSLPKVGGYRGKFSNTTSVYVDNLPISMDEEWLCQLFSPYGDVVHSVIPSKRSKTNSIFGFVRFRLRQEALAAIIDLKGVIIRGHKIYAKIASFPWKGVEDNLNDRFKQNLVGKKPVFSQANMRQPELAKGVSVTDKVSFADIVTGNGMAKAFPQGVDAKGSATDSGSIVIPPNQAHEKESEWLYRSAIGWSTSLRNLDSLMEAFIAEGVSNIHLRDLGGDKVLLTFESIEDMDAMLEESGLKWLSNWFIEVKRWHPDLKVDSKRLVWLSCFGVPLHLWNAATFFTIGNRWGDSLSLDDATSKKSSFSVGKVKVITNTFDAINQVINLSFNGISYPIRVMEEQVNFFNYLKPKCDCKGCGLDRVVSSPNSDEMSSDSDDTMIKGGAEDVLGDMVNKQEVANHVFENIDVNDGCASLMGDSFPSRDCDDLESREANDGDSPSTCDSLVGESREAIDYFEDSATERQLNLFGNSKDGYPLVDNSIGDSNCLVGDGVGADIVEGIEQEGIQLCVSLGSMKEVNNNVVEQTDVFPFDNPVANHLSPVKAALKGSKEEKKRKSIEEILGLPKALPRKSKGGRKNKKCVVLRSAVAAAGLSASVSSEGITNRNHILLNEVQAIHAIDKVFTSSFNKIVGVHFMGDDEEVLSKAKAMWDTHKSIGLSYDGDEEDVIRRIAHMEAMEEEQFKSLLEE